MADEAMAGGLGQVDRHPTFRASLVMRSRSRWQRGDVERVAPRGVLLSGIWPSQDSPL